MNNHKILNNTTVLLVLIVTGIYKIINNFAFSMLIGIIAYIFAVFFDDMAQRLK